MMNAISPQLGLSTPRPLTFSPADSPQLTTSVQTKAQTTANIKTRINKEQIATNFGEAAQTYHAKAQLQRQCSEQLLALLDQSLTRSHQTLPPGPILEIGCGTGFITQRLVERFYLSATDINGCSFAKVNHQFSSPEAHPPQSPLGKGGSSGPPPYQGGVRGDRSTAGIFPRDCTEDDIDNTHHSLHRHPLHITDLSPDMVAFCQSQIESQIANRVESQIEKPSLLPPPPIAFDVRDAENSPAPPQTYSLIIGGFVAQWFKRLEHTVKQLLRQLKPGGRLLLSFPGHRSFPEWREQCDRLHLPFTAHPLPNPHALIQRLHLSPDQYDLRIDMQPTYYPSAKDFFKSMKVIGAGGSDSGHCLSSKQMRQLLHSMSAAQARSPLPTNGNAVSPQPVSHQSYQVEVHYEVVYLSILKRSSHPL